MTASTIKTTITESETESDSSVKSSSDSISDSIITDTTTNENKEIQTKKSFEQTDFLIRECLKTNKLRNKQDMLLFLNSIEIDDWKNLETFSHVRDICKQEGITKEKFNSLYNDYKNI